MLLTVSQIAALTDPENQLCSFVQRLIHENPEWVIDETFLNYPAEKYMSANDALRSLNEAIDQADRSSLPVLIRDETDELTLKLAYEKGGYEGMGDEVIRVYQLVGREKFIMVEAFYTSYQGINWEDARNSAMQPPYLFTEVRYKALP